MIDSVKPEDRMNKESIEGFPSADQVEMITMKRVWMIFVAAVLLLGMVSFAFAEETSESFNGKVSVKVNPTDIGIGMSVELKARVSDANLAYSLQWEKWGKPENEDKEKWLPISGETTDTYKFTAKKSSYQFRVVLTAEDGTVLTSPVTIQAKEPEKQEGSVKQEESSKKEETTKQEKPVKQEEPAKQEESMKQEEPVKQEEPIKQEEPAKQEESVKQEEPTKQEEPVKQEEPAKQEEPVKQEEPAKQEEPVKQDRTGFPDPLPEAGHETGSCFPE